MALIIGGHPRSGTTILQEVCDRHPNISITNEFGNFAYLGQSYLEYSYRMMRRWCRVGNKWAFDLSYSSQKPLGLYNFLFTTRYLLRMGQPPWRPIDVQTIETTLKQTFPEATIVGDKWPDHMFLMDNFVKRDDLYCLVIYRDCRDVTSSFLKQTRTTWRKQAWVNSLNTAEKVARRWVEVMHLTERHADQLHIIRYEDLIKNPKAVFASIGAWLGVDPAGFPVNAIKETSIGKYKKGLTNEELTTVMNIAGPTMAQLGYD
ncbi:MAG: sulfotransferase [Anaerolineae bacterium]|nr:sulfotransferase [Anaerolineae bacterium]